MLNVKLLVHHVTGRVYKVKDGGIIVLSSSRHAYGVEYTLFIARRSFKIKPAAWK